MIKRKDAIKLMASMVNGTHEKCTHNHYKDAETAINMIYDSLKIKTHSKKKKNKHK